MIGACLDKSVNNLSSRRSLKSKQDLTLISWRVNFHFVFIDLEQNAKWSGCVSWHIFRSCVVFATFTNLMLSAIQWFFISSTGSSSDIFKDRKVDRHSRRQLILWICRTYTTFALNKDLSFSSTKDKKKHLWISIKASFSRTKLAGSHLDWSFIFFQQCA